MRTDRDNTLRLRPAGLPPAPGDVRARTIGLIAPLPCAS
jgi:hypothetical protein